MDKYIEIGEDSIPLDAIYEAFNGANVLWGEYGEPRYVLSEGKESAIFGNWNDGPCDSPACMKKTLSSEYPFIMEVDDKEFLNALELHFELEWSDEWGSCSNCGRYVRTSPNSYSWSPSYYLGDGELLCKDCIDYEEILSEFVNDPNKAWIYNKKYLEEAGFCKMEGEDFHAGIREISGNPRDIYKRIKEKDKDIDIVFYIDCVEQFGMEVEIYGRAK